MVKRLLYLIGLAVLQVILFHSAGTGLVAMFFWGHRYLPSSVNPMDQMGSPEYYLLRLIEQVVVVGVPVFLFVSGYFITISAGRSQTNLSWKLIANRIKNLIIPYLVWSAVVMLLSILQGQRISFPELVVRLLTGGSSPVLYFVPLLIQFYLLSPFLVPLARNHWQLLLAVTVVLQLVIQLVQYPMFLGWDMPLANSITSITPKWIFLARLFWFALGMIVGFHVEEFRKKVESLRYWLLGLTLLTIPVGLVEWEYYVHQSGLDWLAHRETILDSLYALGFILTFFAFSKVKLPADKFVGNLGARSYGIFLTHAIFIEFTAKLLYRYSPVLLSNQFLLLPILIAVGLLGPLILMNIVSKIPIPNLYSYLFG